MPTRTATQQDYGRRIARARAHLAADIDRAPGLEELAAVAAFSPYHFHRIYRAITGETPAETLLRARLARAALALQRTPQPIAAIGRRAGYASAAAFTRAFRAAYGAPPGAYRGGQPPPQPTPPGEEDQAMHDVISRDDPGFTLAAIRHVGPYTGIGAAFGRLLAWAGPRGLVGPAPRCIAIGYDPPESVPAAGLRSDAGLVVPPDTPVAGEVRLLQVPPLRVAALVFQGPYSELEGAYRWLYREWLPASGEEPADHPPMEEYLNDCQALPPAEWLTEIRIPLQRR